MPQMYSLLVASKTAVNFKHACNLGRHNSRHNSRARAQPEAAQMQLTKTSMPPC